MAREGREGGIRQHTGEQTGEEGLLLQVSVCGRRSVKGSFGEGLLHGGVAPSAAIPGSGRGTGPRTVSLEVLLAGSDELDGDKLVARKEQGVSQESMFGSWDSMDRMEGGLPALLETLDDGTNEATLEGVLVVAQR